MANRPPVSVIIPAYNAEKYISETIQSVLDQRFQAFELIIVNDGSTDRTEETINAFRSDKRIVYIRQQNQGCSGAKNTGLKVATGTYIQYLDADDILSPDKIEEQMEILKGRLDAIAVCRTVSFSDNYQSLDNPEIDSDFLYSTDNTFEFILNLYGMAGRNGMIQPNAFLISRRITERIGQWNTSLSPSPDEDGEYFCRAILEAKSICFAQKGVNYYRKPLSQKNSLSNQMSHRHAEGALKSLRLISGHLLHKENTRRVRETMAKHFANFMYSYSGYKDLVREAKNEIYKAGIKKIPVTGGENFIKMARWVGFNNALLVKNLFNRKQWH